jgi:quercetin dioxygenase-like cupin family protein
MTMKKSILWLCLTLLPMPAPAVDSAAHQAETLAKSSNSWDGSPLPDYPTGKPEVTILKITIQPGEQLPMHEHHVINAGVLLSGKLTVVTEEGSVLHLKAGEALIETVNKWHYGKNEGDTPAEIIVFYAGTPGVPLATTK